MLSLAIATASSSPRERLDRQHRAERLVLGDRHVAGAAVEDRGQVVEAVGASAGVVGTATAAPQHGALGDARGDVRLDLVAVGGAGERPGLGLLVERPAEPDRPGPLDELVDERVVDRLLDQQPGAGGADLPRVQEDRGERVVEGDVEVGVGEDDVGVLAAELEGDLLHGGRGGGHDRAAGLQAAGEGDQVDPRVRRQRRARVRSGAEHQVADTGRQAGLLEQPHQVDRGVRGELARLQHEGVAGRQARRDLPGDLEQRVVPRRDQAAHADRLVHDPADHVGVAGVDHPAGFLGRDPAVVAEHGDDVVDVVLRLDQALAGVERLHPRDRVLVAHQQVGDPQQQVTALAGRRRRPRAGVERTMGRLDRGLGVVGRRLVDLGDQGPVRGAADLAAITGSGRAPLPVDVEIRHGRSPF